MPDEPTIYDIAAKAGVGIATVSRVLNGSERVSEPTRDAVQRAMLELGFRPNRAARRLAQGGPNRPRVAALMPFFSATFYYAVSKPLSQGLSQADIDLVLCNVVDRDDKNRLLDRICAERSCEALVLCSMGIGEDRRAQLQRAGIPVVVIDYPLPGVPSVTVDNAKGAAMAARHLLAAGATRLGFLCGPSAALAFRDRERGFREVAGDDAPMVRADSLSVEAGRSAAKRLLAEHPDVDGIATVNDVLAVGALEELRAAGCAVPDDIQVIGFDDQPLIDVIGVTTVRQPMERFGAWGARAVRELLEQPGTAPASEELELTLVVRATTRKGQSTRSPGRSRRD